MAATFTFIDSQQSTGNERLDRTAHGAFGKARIQSQPVDAGPRFTIRVGMVGYTNEHSFLGGLFEFVIERPV